MDEQTSGTVSDLVPSVTSESGDSANPSPTGAASRSGISAKFLRSFLTPAGKTAAWNLIWLIAGTVVAQVCGLVVILLLTGSLSPRDFGIYAFGFNLYGYMVLAANAGLPPIIIRELNRRPAASDQITTAYFAISLTASAVVAAITFLGLSVVPVSRDEWFLLACMATSNLIACGRMMPFYDVLHRQSLSALLAGIADVLWLVGIVWLESVGRLSLFSVGIAFLVKWGFANSLPLLVYWGHFERPKWRFDLAEVITTLASSWHVLIMQLAATVPLTAGVFLARFFNGEAAAGVFGLAAMVAQTYLQFLVVAIRIVVPHITGPYGREASFRKKLWAFFLCFALLILLGVIAGLAILVAWILGPDYDEVFSIGLFLVVGALPLGVSWMMIQVLMAENRMGAVSTTQVAAAAVFLLLAVPGAYFASSTGIAIAFFLSALVAMLISWLACRSLRGEITGVVEAKREEN